MLIVQYCRAHLRLAALCGAFAFGLVAGFANLGAGLERALQEAGWLLRGHSASQDLHIVEIDARSIAAIDRWPWPRSNHATVIDQLRKAGVGEIAFDVDFSSQSSAAEDAALAAALVRADGKVILPTFRQQAGGGREGWTDSMPIEPLREHSLAAAVSILPEANGYVRRAPVGTITEGLPRPSLSAMLAGNAGSADRDFPIDFALNPASIPRHSFLDIRDGKFDPAALAGKQVLIGATAVEMGDRYVVPVHGVLPGVVIQAMAAETLTKGVPREAGWPAALVPAILLAWCILQMRSSRAQMVTIVAAPIAIFSGSILAQSLLNWYFQIVPALFLILAASAATVALRLLAANRHGRLHDSQTGMPNRAALTETLRESSDVGLIAVCFTEFDKLAAVVGAAQMPEVILRVCDRIALLAEGATIHRMEDRILCWRCDNEADAERQLTTLRTIMLNAVEVCGRRIDVVLTAGYAKDDAQDPVQAAANAALAATQALTMGASWHFHRSSDDDAINRDLSLLTELDEAIDNQQIEVLYQPKLDIKSGRIASVEALVRWHHATRGLLSPDLFVPLAERNDRIAGLTLYALGRTIADLGRMRKAGHAISGAVNLSAKLLDAPDFIAELRQLVETSRVEPSRLIFEVTESAAMRDPAAAAAALQSFKDLGIAISMDDYGTGQSALSYIQQLPLDELKIDRRFVQHVHENRGDAVLVRSTIDLAHGLGLKVVAEGVEDIACLDFLRSAGCDLAQGYLISRPITATKLLGLLKQDSANAA